MSGDGDHTYVPARGDVPAYTLRVSPRAHHVRLTVTPRHGLVVTVPPTLRDYDPTHVLRARRDWIDGATAHFATRRAAITAPASERLPDEVELAVTGEQWPVRFRETFSASVRAGVREGVLVVSGRVGDADASLAALQRWLQRAARERLLPLLDEEAARVGVAFRRAGVRAQRGRWAGYSAGTITLNRALLFLPPELVRAAMLHELAHACHPNHSAEFRAELARLDPDADEHAAAIAQSWDAVPPWAEP